MYKPGDKLPNEMVLVETLGVSRTTLRDAIAAATHNELIIRLYENISTATVEAFDNESVIQKNDQVLVLSHRMITEMLKRRDAEGAKLAMRLHIKPSIEFYNLDKWARCICLQKTNSNPSVRINGGTKWEKSVRDLRALTKKAF